MNGVAKEEIICPVPRSERGGVDRFGTIWHDNRRLAPSTSFSTINGYAVAVSRTLSHMPENITPAERYLRQRIDSLKLPRTPEDKQTLELESIDHALEILGALNADAFARRPQAWQKLEHAIDYLKSVRTSLNSEQR